MRRLVVASLIAVLASHAAGCSFSASSKGSSKSSASLSDIVSSPFRSSSRSSSPEDAYQDEVEEFTASYLRSGGSPAKLEQEVGAIAEKRGISDWQSNEATYVGIGRGLQKAGFAQAELDGYKASVTDTEQQAGWIQAGYDERD